MEIHLERSEDVTLNNTVPLKQLICHSPFPTRLLSFTCSVLSEWTIMYHTAKIIPSKIHLQRVCLQF